MRKIKSIEKGWGEGSAFFSTDEKFIGYPTFVHEIKEETKVLGMGMYNDITTTVYRGYEYPDTDPKFEIESGSQLTIIYL